MMLLEAGSFFALAYRRSLDRRSAPVHNVLARYAFIVRLCARMCRYTLHSRHFAWQLV